VGAAKGNALLRAISGPMLLFFVIGDVLGAGIYALVGEVGGRVGGAIWASFAVALALAMFTAFSYAELVTKYPRAAGAALYANNAFGVPFVTFMVAFVVASSGLTSAATLARAFGGDYLSAFVAAPELLVGIVMIVVLALINLWGIGLSIRFNFVLTAIELTGLLLVVAIGLAAVLSGHGDPGRAIEFKHDTAVPLAILSGTGLAFFALVGFEDSVNMAEETRDPTRSYPRALFGGLLIAGTIYVLVSVVASIVVPTDQLTSSSAPLLDAIDQGPLAMPRDVFSAIALFALANGALINMIMASRLIYGMANEGIVPAQFGRVLSGRRSPWVAIAFTTAIAIALVLTGGLTGLADTTVLLLLGVFVVVNVSALVLRRDRVSHDHFRAPTAVPVIGVAVSIALITTKDAETFARAGVLLAVGGLLWVATRLAGRRAARAGA
jgi:amino acid transporter